MTTVKLSADPGHPALLDVKPTQIVV